MKQILRTIAATFVLLFSIHSAQAATVPTVPIANVFSPDLVIGNSYSKDGFLPDTIPLNVAWFQFTLSGPANVSLDTDGSSDPLGSILALYDDTDGTLLGQNNECPADSDYSCLSFGNLGTGTYIAGVTDWILIGKDEPFIDGWMLDTASEGGDTAVKLNITVSAVPVPAAVWLFGTALIGFVGMSRRRSVKS
jgi:hypothetical protein